jgi:hypothetical protein
VTNSSNVAANNITLILSHKNRKNHVESPLSTGIRKISAIKSGATHSLLSVRTTRNPRKLYLEPDKNSWRRTILLRNADRQRDA